MARGRGSKSGRGLEEGDELGVEASEEEFDRLIGGLFLLPRGIEFSLEGQSDCENGRGEESEEGNPFCLLAIA